MTKKEIAEILDGAAITAQAVPQMATANGVSLKDAYDIQRELIELRINRGESITGYKLGFTSKAKMLQMGVNDLIWGILTDAMEVSPGSTARLAQWIHPRVEPEIAFRVSENINGEISLEEIPHYIDKMAVALEIIDSRYENFKFTLEDVVADNCSSTGYVLGTWHDLNTNISSLKIDLFENNVLVESATAAAILDNPLQSVVELSRLMFENSIQVKKGDVILAGAATAAIFLKPGCVYTTVVEGLGTVSFSVK